MNRMLLFILFLGLGNMNSNAQTSWDTSYYVSCKNRLSLGLVFSQRGYQIDIKSDTGSIPPVNYNADARSAVGFILDFDKLSVQALFKTREHLNDKKGKTRNNNFLLTIGGNKFLFEGSYRFFKGFYDETSGDYLPEYNENTPYYQLNGMTENLFRAKVYYFSNNRKFSYRSAYYCGYRQIKSAFSAVITANFMNERLVADSSLIPYFLKTNYGNASNIRGIAHTGFGTGAGITGTIVIYKRFFANFFFVPSIHVQHRSYKYTAADDKSGYYGTLLLDTRLSVGFTGERFFTLMAVTNDRHWINGKGISIQPSYVSATFIIGYRFTVSKQGFVKKVKDTEIYNKL